MLEALRLAEMCLAEAKASVARAQIDSDSAATRATFLRAKIERAIDEA